MTIKKAGINGEMFYKINKLIHKLLESQKLNKWVILHPHILQYSAIFVSHCFPVSQATLIICLFPLSTMGSANES
jgi:hypothetical protein